jgi:hypothetical protein
MIFSIDVNRSRMTRAMFSRKAIFHPVINSHSEMNTRKRTTVRRYASARYRACRRFDRKIRIGVDPPPEINGRFYFINSRRKRKGVFRKSN